MILLVETIISVYRTLKSKLKRESYAQNKIQGPICSKTKFYGAFINKNRAKTLFHIKPKGLRCQNTRKGHLVGLYRVDRGQIIKIRTCL
jgi:hypothetical protein